MASTIRSVWSNLASAFKGVFSRDASGNGVTTNIDVLENLGRGVFDSKKAKHASAGKIAPRIFRERDGICELSVDRLSIGDHTRLVEIHDQERLPQLFQGWAQVSLENAEKLSRKAVASPLPSNPWHAEIILPDVDATEFADMQDQHALNLAMAAVWIGRPST